MYVIQKGICFLYRFIFSYSANYVIQSLVMNNCMEYTIPMMKDEVNMSTEYLCRK